MIDVILWAFSGATVGLLAHHIFKSDRVRSTLEDIVLGIAGAYAGGFIITIINSSKEGAIPAEGLLFSFLGAVCLIGIHRALFR